MPDQIVTNLLNATMGWILNGNKADKESRKQKEGAFRVLNVFVYKLNKSINPLNEDNEEMFNRIMRTYYSEVNNYILLYLKKIVNKLESLFYLYIFINDHNLREASVEPIDELLKNLHEDVVTLRKLFLKYCRM